MNLIHLYEILNHEPQFAGVRTPEPSIIGIIRRYYTPFFPPEMVEELVETYTRHLIMLCVDFDRPLDPRVNTLPDGLYEVDGKIYYYCRHCEQATEWEGEIADFDFCNPANVCGRSPRCCP